MKEIPKTEFKAKALEIMRMVEQSNESILITNHGKPVLELKAYSPLSKNPLQTLKNSVFSYADPFEPVGESDWETNP